MQWRNKGGFEYGSTDELGFSIAENPVHVHDMQATWLHLLGLITRNSLTGFQGRDYRLTDVHGNVLNRGSRKTTFGNHRYPRERVLLSCQKRKSPQASVGFCLRCERIRGTSPLNTASLCPQRHSIETELRPM